MTTRRTAYSSHATAFLSGRESPLALAEQALAVLDAREAELRAFVVHDAPAALAAAHRSARRWREGCPLSPLDGILLGVKDIIETHDFATGQGAPCLSPVRMGRDGATVQALRAAGAIVLGKTVTTEFAATELFTDTRNPCDRARTPGGSSAGSAAAVGAGMVGLALGSQVVGSTLRPASYCGVVGFKPSLGALNRGGSFDHLSQSCVGLLGGALADVWIAGREIARRVGGDPGHAGLTGPDLPPPAHRPARLIVLRTAGWEVASDGAQKALAQACARLRQAGCEVIEPEDAPEVAAFDSAIAPAMEITWAIISREVVWPLGALVAQDPRHVSAPMRARLETGAAMRQHDYAQALARRAALRHAYGALLEAVGAEAVITLAATGAAPPVGGSTGNPAFNLPASLLGVPALSLPLLADGAMPLGLQVIGRIDQDARTVAIARWIETALGGAE